MLSDMEVDWLQEARDDAAASKTALAQEIEAKDKAIRRSEDLAIQLEQERQKNKQLKKGEKALKQKIRRMEKRATALTVKAQRADEQFKYAQGLIDLGDRTIAVLRHDLEVAETRL